jgi:signal transduction histidine kinase/ActR/RegA family two-component response regulator
MPAFHSRPAEELNRRERERSRVLIRILTAGAIVSGSMFLLVPLWQESPGKHLVGYGVTFFLHVAHLALVRSGRPLLAARSFIVFFFTLMTALVYSYGGIRGLGGFVYPLVVLAAGLTWSGAAAVGFAVLSSVAAALMAWMETRGFLTSVLPDVNAMASWAVITASVTMTAVMLFVALAVIRASQEEAVESERKRRELELELSRAKRMEALGQLAGGLAHDFNNMLTGIIGHAELVALKAAGNEELARHAQLILGTGERAAQLTRQLLTFSRKRERVVEPVSLHRLVENVVAILERTIDRRIALKLDLRASPDLVDGDPALLESALLNLGINARDAITGSGTIGFSTERADSGEGPTPSVRVRVSDSGIGISETDLDRIFEPYFTTKGVGKGTGLGLAAVYGTVRDHGGTVGVESTVGEGTTFAITLPASAAEQEGDVVAESEPCDGETRLVLAVDDEAAVLEALRGMLEGLGHTVLTACDGVEALEILDRHRGAIELVVLDLMMPRMSGRQVLERAGKTLRTIPVILTSGYSSDSLSEIAADGRVRLLAKPYRQSELAMAIADVSAPRAERKSTRPLLG